MSTNLRIYLCASMQRQAQMRRVAEHLTAVGIEVTSRWLVSTSDDVLGQTAMARHALADLADIDASHLVLAQAEVYGSTPAYVTGGRHVEFGYAVAKRLPILLVGCPENIFAYLPGVQRCDTWAEAFTRLGLVVPEDLTP